jgi:DNA repair exonuclease SbcCD ATPase subunit/DNA repair exonuclease SbcCD nuclease subunit
MKFAHIADTHIRNLKYHNEYREVFQKLYKSLRENEVDFIVHCGDIAHTKTQISPEFVEMCSDFLRNLADIAPTYVILGNHDGNLRNSGRQDALSPIVSALNHDKLFLLKNSGETVVNDSFTLNVLSVFDRDNWIPPSDKNKINIALYHGSISGVKTDIGWVMESGENNIDIFNNFDYSFLGDIHKTNQILDKEGKIRYPGSTVQQNHGETNDKGYLLWDIQSKDSFACQHFAIENPKPFLTIKLTPKGRLPNKLDIPTSSRMRLTSENNLPLDVVRKAIDAAKIKYSPESVTYLSRAAGERANIEESTNRLKKGDLRDIAVQEGLIKEFLEDYQPSDDTTKKIFDLNKKYNSLAEQEEEVHRNINWRLVKLEWDNLFNYGEGNQIDFENLNGITGILGKNFSGKSSIIDSLLYTLYNTTSKNNRKNLNLINQNKDSCRGYVEITVGTRKYTIERTSQKYTKKLKGKETLEAKTDVEFMVTDMSTSIEESLNGVSRIETDKNIRKVFGTIEDFFMTSMASQLDSLAYLNEGSTKRKEILGKFLDLELFDKKFRMAKDDTAELTAALRRLSGRDFDSEISEARTELARTTTELSVKEREIGLLKTELEQTDKNIAELQRQIVSLPKEVIDIKNIKNQLKECEENISFLEGSNQRKQENLGKEKQFLAKIENFVQNFDIEMFNDKKKLYEEYKHRLEEIELEISQYEEERRSNNKKIELLKRVPCSYDLKEKCMFVKDAHLAVKDASRVKIGVNQLSLNKGTLQKKIDDLNPDQISQYIEKYQLILDKKANHHATVVELELSIEKNKTRLFQLEHAHSEMKEKEEVYEQNRELIENFETLLEKESELGKSKKILEKELSSMKEDLLSLYKASGSLEQKFHELVEHKNDFCDLENQHAVTDLYMRCMHPNGISYDVIKKQLPVINSEISKILANIVDFEVFFENDEQKLDILIKHPKHGPRPIEMGSGAEKTIAAMVIRLALLNVSTLPKGDMFVLDEPGTALDADNMEGFIRILDMIKAQFKTVLLISHLDSLKDVVDQQLLIEKRNEMAFISE